MDAMRLDDWKKSLRFFITYSIFVISSTVRRVSHAAFSALGETLSAGDDAIISDVGSILVVMNGDAILSGGSLLVVCDDDVVFRDNDTNGRRSEA